MRAIWVKKGFAPDKFENHTSIGKGKEKKKSEKEASPEEKKKKAMVALLVL